MEDPNQSRPNKECEKDKYEIKNNIEQSRWGEKKMEDEREEEECEMLCGMWNGIRWDGAALAGQGEVKNRKSERGRQVSERGFFWCRHGYLTGAEHKLIITIQEKGKKKH